MNKDVKLRHVIAALDVKSIDGGMFMNYKYEVHVSTTPELVFKGSHHLKRYSGVVGKIEQVVEGKR